MDPAPFKETVPFEVLERIDIRVGTIVAAEGLETSKKLARLTVDLGSERRTILAGLKAERPDLSGLEGVQALFVVNLEPRPMAGEVSHGMLFDIGYADGLLPALAVPERPVPNGARLG